MKRITVSTRITNRESNLVDAYFNDISKYEQLTKEEEVDLGRRIREDNDKFALEKLVKSNLRFAVTVAKAYQTTGFPLNDLISDANEGLINAASKFDERKGFKFISYAVWWIKQSVLSSINKNGKLIRLPSNKMSELTKMNRFIEKFLVINGREPSKEECCMDLKISSTDFDYLTHSQMPTLYLSRPMGEDSNSSLEDVLESESYSDYGSLNKLMKTEAQGEAVKEILSLLSPRESDALKIDFGLGGTYEEVAHKYDISKERVRQLKQMALIKIRSKKGIKRYLELI